MKGFNTDYGFVYGPATIQRICSDDKKGWVVLEVVSAKTNVQIYVTKTGKIRVFGKDGKELKSPRL